MSTAAAGLTADGYCPGEFSQWLQCAGQGLSAPFCPGDPCCIDLKALVAEGILAQEEYEDMFPGADETDESYNDLYRVRRNLLTMAYERSNVSLDPEFRDYVEKNGWWLREYALFMALKEFFAGQCWDQWPEDIRLRYSYSLDYYRRELYFDIEYQMYLQFKLDQQTCADKITNRTG